MEEVGGYGLGQDPILVGEEGEVLEGFLAGEVLELADALGEVVVFVLALSLGGVEAPLDRLFWVIFGLC